MRDELVRVEFGQPCQYKTSGASVFLEQDGVSIQLPKSRTQVEQNDDGLVVAVTIPQWLAKDRGLTGNATHPQGNDKMSREDWFLLGTTAAMLIRGDKLPVFEARKVVAKMLEDE